MKDLLEEKKSMSGGGKKEEESLDSGAVTHMPHNRLQLAPRKGKLEERIVCGCEWCLSNNHELLINN